MPDAMLKAEAVLKGTVGTAVLEVLVIKFTALLDATLPVVIDALSVAGVVLVVAVPVGVGVPISPGKKREEKENSFSHIEVYDQSVKEDTHGTQKTLHSRVYQLMKIL